MNPDALDRHITGNYGEDQFQGPTQVDIHEFQPWMAYDPTVWDYYSVDEMKCSFCDNPVGPCTYDTVRGEVEVIDIRFVMFAESSETGQLWCEDCLIAAEEDNDVIVKEDK